MIAFGFDSSLLWARPLNSFLTLTAEIYIARTIESSAHGDSRGSAMAVINQGLVEDNGVFAGPAFLQVLGSSADSNSRRSEILHVLKQSIAGSVSSHFVHAQLWDIFRLQRFCSGTAKCRLNTFR